MVVSGAGKRGVCVNNTEPLSSIVISFAPECFEACPELCSTVDAVLGVYLDTGDVEMTGRKVCDLASSFERVFEKDNMELCRPILTKGKSLGLELPTTNESFVARCEALSLRAHNAQGDNGTEDLDSDESEGRMGVASSSTILALFTFVSYFSYHAHQGMGPP